MISIMIMISLLILAATTTYLIHPLTLAGLLMLTALFSAVLMGKLMSSWFMYMLTLVFLGGVMVVLLFMVSLCSNEQFTATPMSLYPTVLPAILTLFVFNPTPNLCISFSSNQMMLGLYSNDTSWCFVLMIITLILCMISAISLSKIEGGPMIKRL